MVMVRFSRVGLAAVPMCHPQVIRSRQLIRHDGGNASKSQDNREGLRALPLKAMECGFIWELDCGKKDRRLFKKAIKTLNKIARHTNDLSLFTDGERRYGNLLFEICSELVKNGQPGRPKKTFKRGVHVRIKNKGSQAHKKGPKRPTYQS